MISGRNIGYQRRSIWTRERAMIIFWVLKKEACVGFFAGEAGWITDRNGMEARNSHRYRASDSDWRKPRWYQRRVGKAWLETDDND
jgi:hypothetical protein